MTESNRKEHTKQVGIVAICLASFLSVAVWQVSSCSNYMEDARTERDRDRNETIRKAAEKGNVIVLPK